MTVDELVKLREKKKVTVLDVAARTGLPEEYIEKIESGKAVALESDLKRIHNAILQAGLEKSGPDAEEMDTENRKKFKDRLVDDDI